MDVNATDVVMEPRLHVTNPTSKNYGNAKRKRYAPNRLCSFEAARHIASRTIDEVHRYQSQSSGFMNKTSSALHLPRLSMFSLPRYAVRRSAHVFLLWRYGMRTWLTVVGVMAFVISAGNGWAQERFEVRSL